MRDHRENLHLHGDVVALTEITVDRRSGSLRATLKKELQERLGPIGNQLTAAALQFASGPSAVLLCGTGGGAAVAIGVHRVGANRYEIELETGEDTEVDDVTAAFLVLKIDQFKKGRLPLLPAVTADEWQEEMDEKFRAAEAKAEADATRR